MNKAKFFFSVFAVSLLILVSLALRAAELPRYELDVQIQPASHELAVDASVTFPPAYAGKSVEFLLATPLDISMASPKVTRLPAAQTAGFTGINGSSAALEESGHAARYRVHLSEEDPVLHLRYKGKINFELVTPPEESARSFSQTAGIVGEQGVYLAGATLWYPFIGDTLFKATVHTHAPDGWHLITVDPGTPVDELPLVGGPLTRYSRSVGAVEAEVFLRTPDEALANKYLQATARDITMYSQLIGPYPYDKFALVENFWETGYGMPTFTLLGPQIIHFPFILTSSYPHEILHNWWGNSVFPDYATGNWSEGLTAYMADHLFKEQEGKGAEYRRDTLKRYRDYVKQGSDFPLNQFRARNSPESEAVGYGKTLMGFHMLRRKLGDKTFIKALQAFYRNHRGERAGFMDLKAAFAKAGGVNLDQFFDQWVNHAGAVQLKVAHVQVDGRRVRGVIQQVQSTPALRMDVPLSMRTKQGYQNKIITIEGRKTAFDWKLDAQPLLLEVDPEFDMFRLLDPRETAPSIGQIFGDTDVLAVLPAKADKATRSMYRDMLDKWAAPGQNLEVKLDSEVAALPADRSVWILGRANRYAKPLLDAAQARQAALSAQNQSIVLVRRHPGNINKAVGLVAVEKASAASALARKLPHYGKYSYLAFEGDDATNTLKGKWPTDDSPLRFDLRSGEAAGQALEPLPRAERAALAELPPLFDADTLRAHVDYLAAPERDGRGLGTQGIKQAADYISHAFKDAGLQPVGDDGGWLQAFPKGSNVLGALPGTNPAFKDQAIVVSAHYDHLGEGYPGADDNASGVAVLIELARVMAKTGPYPRTVVFAAFSGEESGLLGSRWYVAHPTPVALSGIRANVNMDTVGRLEGKPVSVIGTATATEWPPIFRFVGFATGIQTKALKGATQSSDQQAFIEHGIPAIQLFSGPNLDYHQPTDTPDKIDADGLVTVATLAREVLVYLAERAEPMHPTISEQTEHAGQQAAPGSKQRQASLGVVPDFQFAGEGVRAGSIVPESAAAQAGLAAGDIVVALGDQPVTSLKALSDALKALEPGDKVVVKYQRGGEPGKTEATLGSR